MQCWWHHNSAAMLTRMWWHYLQLAVTLRKGLCKFESNLTDGFGDTNIFVLPLFFHVPMFFWPSETQQLITQSAQATANATASEITAQTASISLPIYNHDSKDAYHSFSIFWHTLENWLLLNHIATDSEDHLWYVFTALGTKSLEMHVQWMPTWDEQEWRATKVKASAFLDKIHQHPCMIGELEDVIARPREDPQDLDAYIKTLMDHCKMINDEHWEHKLLWCIVHAYHHEGKLFDTLMAKSFKTPSSELTDITMNHFAIKQAWELVSHSSTPVDAICHDKCWGACTSHVGDGHTPPEPHRECLNCTWQSSWQKKTAPQGIPDAPSVARLGTWAWNAMVVSHLYQRMHLQLGYSMGCPDVHLGATAATLAGVVKLMP